MLNAKEKGEKYKDRLIEKGYSQLEGIEFDEIFSHLAKLNFVRFFLSIFIAFDFEVQ